MSQDKEVKHLGVTLASKLLWGREREKAMITYAVVVWSEKVELATTKKALRKCRDWHAFAYLSCDLGFCFLLLFHIRNIFLILNLSFPGTIVASNGPNHSRDLVNIVLFSNILVESLKGM